MEAIGCTNCGHEGAPSSTFCLNCGTLFGGSEEGTADNGSGVEEGENAPSLYRRVQKPTPVPGSLSAIATPDPAHGKICEQCSASNTREMKFCRQCGTLLPEGVGSVAPAVDQDMGATIISAPPVQAASVPQELARDLVTSPELQERDNVEREHSESSSSKGFPLRFDSELCSYCHGRTPRGFAFCQRCGKPLQPRPDLMSSSKQRATQPPVTARRVSSSVPVARETTAEPWGTLISVKRSGVEGNRYVLQGDYVEIGGGAPAQICFEDPYLAPIHARIERLGARSARIVPVDGLNGVFLRIRADVVLSSGAHILVGRQVLRFDSLSDAEANPHQLVQHGVLLLGSPCYQAWGRLSLVLPSGSIRDIRYLQKNELVVGREEGDICFRDDEFLSRRHAEFRHKKGTYWLADLGSANGTFLRIAESYNLSDGDVLRIGEQMFRYVPTGR